MLWYARGRKHQRNLSRLAQLVERRSNKPKVSGSNPLPRTSDVAQWLARPAHNREVRGSIPLIASKASLSVKYG